MALVAAAALGVAVGYLWRFAETQSEAALLLGVVLGLLAVAFGFACGDARTPLLVADETGLRVRLGRDWTGIPWGQVQRVEVAERGRFRDGHVAVVTATATASLGDAGWRSRLAALLNRWLYDAPFVVPFGPTTICSVVDVQRSLERLAAGRAPVVDVDAARAEPVPTVVTHDNEAPPEASTPNEPADVTGESDADPRAHEPEQANPQKEEPKPGLPPMAARVVSAFRSRPARREEVTVPFGAEPATMGMLALSDPLRREQQPGLPELGQLRYLADEVAPQPVPDPEAETPHRDNVSLIIDATTDLSRRAMSKVRRPAASPAESDEAVAPSQEPVVEEPLLIGAELARARKQLGLTVDDLADRTRIRPSVIEALEVDDFGPAGGDFYARGHLRMIARVLGIDADELLTTYDTHFATNPVSPRQVFEVELASGTTGMVRGTRGGSRWGGLIAAVLVLMIVWGLAQYFIADTAPTENADVPQNAAGLGSPGVGNPEPSPVTDAPKARFTATAVDGDSWIVVRDGSKEEVFEGRLLDGESRKLVGEAPLRVLAMKGGVVSVSVRGQDLGLIGEVGESRARTQVQADEGRADPQSAQGDAESSAP
jgi:hypothetical protein